MEKTQESPNTTIPPYDRSGISCPHCAQELPKSLFITYLKTNFIRYFVFTFVFAFTLITVISDIRAHYSNSQAPVTPLNPYTPSVIIAGAFALLGWLGQKRKEIHKKLQDTREAQKNDKS